MALRNGYLLCWMKDRKLITLDIGREMQILPIFTTQESARAAATRIPIPPNGILLAIEIVVDEQGRFKYAAAGGSFRDLTLDWSRLKPMWDTDMGFEESFARGVSAYTANRSTTDPFHRR